MKTKKPVQKTEQTPLEKAIKEDQQGRAKQVETKIAEYEKLIDALPDLLSLYGIQVKQLCVNVKMARGTFYNRVARLDFPPGDLRKVYKYIENYPRTHKNTPETHEVSQDNKSPHPSQEKTPEAPELPVVAPETPEIPQAKQSPQFDAENSPEHVKMLEDQATEELLASIRSPAPTDPNPSFNYNRLVRELEANKKKKKNTN